MSRRAVQAQPESQEFTEKDFYLDEFRGHCLLIAAHASQLAGSGAARGLSSVIRDLVPNDTRLLIVVGAEDATDAARALRSLRRQLGSVVSEEAPPARASRKAGSAFLSLVDGEPDSAAVSKIWEALRHTPAAVAIVSCGSARLAEYAQRLATLLRVHKLVLLEDAGGVADSFGRPLSFMDAAMLDALLEAGEAESTGVAHRRATLAAVRRALEGGVAAVNLCSLEGLERELFTYEGSGTLFTLADYCRVERLGIDDFEEVERLIERGQREGFLKMRSREQITQILLCGYGANIGEHHLAGIAALYTEPYVAERAGEIVGLYTVTRFKSESVGRKLLARIQSDANGLDYLFACTTEARAQAFFERSGFRRVGAADVPAVKWVGYDPERRERVAVFRLDLPKGGSSS